MAREKVARVVFRGLVELPGFGHETEAKASACLAIGVDWDRRAVLVGERVYPLEVVSFLDLAEPEPLPVAPPAFSMVGAKPPPRAAPAPLPAKALARTTRKGDA